MGLSNEIISQFVKATKDDKNTKTETTVYGTVVEHGDSNYVRLDGSELLTPISTTADARPGERVTVLIKNHTATITGNISSPAARVDDIEDVSSMRDKIAEVEILVAGKVSTDEFDAQTGRIDSLVSDNVLIKEGLYAAEGDIDNLQTNMLTVNESLTAAEANIKKIQTEKIDATFASATYATISDLEATNADVHNLEATYGDISSLMFGSATGTTIQTSFSNAVIAQLGDAQIKSAMIESVSADKIMAGDIITNNVRVMSEDGKLLISDETIQISDGTRVRVQIGKDAAGDYSVNVWDAEGKLMFSEGGITDAAIKDAIIRNDMVCDDANIAAHKLDIDSLFEEINGSTNTIKSTQIYLDDEKQTLDVAFKELESEVTELGTTVTSQGTDISVIQGQIASKIWQQDINAATDEMSTQYSTLEQEVDGISATVANYTSVISEKADSSTVAAISDKVTSLEVSVDGFKTTVSDTYATKTELYDIESSISQLSDNITTNVTETNNLKTQMSTVKQTASDLSVGLEETDNKIDDAAKTATNYLNFSSSGLVVGDMTSSSLGKNVLIDSDSVDIRNGSTVMASFGAKELILGQNAADSKINLCDGAATINTITSGATTSYPHYDGINIASEEIEMESSQFRVDTTSGSSFVNSGTIRLNNQSSAAGSTSSFKSECKIASSGSRLSTGLLASATSSASTTCTDIYASHYNASSGTTNSNYISVYPTHTQMSKPITINGIYVTALNKHLWSGSNYMNSGQSITLSEAISAQVNGIVLIWSYYENGAAKDYNFHSHFVPKWVIIKYEGKGYDFDLANHTGNVLGHKYLYISDTKITGNDNNQNTVTGTRATYNNTYFVLRAVIGV